MPYENSDRDSDDLSQRVRDLIKHCEDARATAKHLVEESKQIRNVSQTINRDQLKRLAAKE